MEHRAHIGWAIMAAVAMVGCMVSYAQATDFPASGGSYLANVASQWDNTATRITSATATYTGSGGSSNDVNRVIDTLDGAGVWSVTGLAGTGDSAAAIIDMGKVWTLNKIHTEYQYWATKPATYSLRLSTDGSTWTTVVGPAAVGSENIDDTFAATDARYVEWKVSGPGGAGLMELQAYVAGTAADVPQMEAGYNIARGATYVEAYYNINSPGWMNRMGLFDGSFHGDAGLYPDATPGQSCVIDLGGSYMIDRIVANVYATLNDGQFAISNDDPSLDNWTVIKGPGSLSDSEYAFAPQLARYIRFIGDNEGSNAQFKELQVFTAPAPEVVIPEPATMALLAVGGLAALVRRRRRA